MADYPRLAMLVYKFLVLVFMKSLYKVVLFRTSAITLAPLPLHTVSVAFVIPNVNSAALIAAYSNFRVPNALPGFPMRCLVRKCSGRYEETKNSTPLISSHSLVFGGG